MDTLLQTSQLLSKRTNLLFRTSAVFLPSCILLEMERLAAFQLPAGSWESYQGCWYHCAITWTPSQTQYLGNQYAVIQTITSVGHQGVKAEKRKLEEKANPKKKAKCKSKAYKGKGKETPDVKEEAPESHEGGDLDDDVDLENDEEEYDEDEDEWITNRDFNRCKTILLALSMYAIWPSFWVLSAKQTLGVARSQLRLITWLIFPLPKRNQQLPCIQWHSSRVFSWSKASWDLVGHALNGFADLLPPRIHIQYVSMLSLCIQNSFPQDQLWRKVLRLNPFSKQTNRVLLHDYRRIFDCNSIMKQVWVVVVINVSCIKVNNISFWFRVSIQKIQQQSFSWFQCLGVMAKCGAASSSLWATSLQSTVANLVTELFHLLATGNVSLVAVFLQFFLVEFVPSSTTFQWGYLWCDSLFGMHGPRCSGL